MNKTLNLKNHLAELDRLTAAVTEMAKNCDFPDRRVLELNLVLEEIVTNIMKYAYGPDVDLPIELHFHWDGEFLHIDVTDSGPAFDPLLAPMPDTTQSLELRRIGGLGILLVKKLMDDLHYRREDGKNILTIKSSKNCCSAKET